MKYLIVKKGNVEAAILFPEHLMHSEVGRVHRVGERIVVSAGFCERKFNGEWETWGRSDSLDIDSRPEDAEVLYKSFPYGELVR